MSMQESGMQDKKSMTESRKTQRAGAKGMPQAGRPSEEC